MSRPLEEHLNKSLATEYNDVRERERTATPIRAFAVRLHSAGLSFQEAAAILELLDVDRSNQAIWQWKEQLADSAPDLLSASPTRVAVDETAVKIDGEWKWVYAAIDAETKLLLDIAVSAVIALILLQRFSMDSPRNTMSKTRCFSSVAMAIRLSPLVSD